MNLNRCIEAFNVIRLLMHANEKHVIRIGRSPLSMFFPFNLRTINDAMGVAGLEIAGGMDLFCVQQFAAEVDRESFFFSGQFAGCGGTHNSQLVTKKKRCLEFWGRVSYGFSKQC